MTDIRHRLLKGTFWLAGARLVSNSLAFIGTLIVARVLLPADFGLVALGTTMLAVLSAVTDIPLSEALVRHKDPSPDHFHTAWTMSFIRAAAIAAVFAAASWPAAVFYHDGRLSGIMVALSAGVVLTGVENPRTIMLTKDLVFWQQFMLQVARQLVSVVVTIIVALAYHSYWALIVGSLSGQAVGVAVSYTVLPFRPRLRLQHTRELMSFSVWLTFCQVVNTLNWKFDQLLVGIFLGKAQLGYYTVGDKLAIIPTREATTPLITTLFPAFSKVIGDRSRLAAAYQSAQALVTAVALPAGVAVALLADPLVRVTMGDKWAPAVLVVQVLASVFAMQTLGTLAQPLAMAAGETRMLFRRDLQAFAVRIPFIIIGMYFGGLAGILYARAVFGTAGILLNTNIVSRITGLTLLQQIRANVRSVIATAAMAGVMMAVRTMLSPGSTWGHIHELLFLATSGIGAYLVVTTTLWRAMGSPNGPETEVVSILFRTSTLGRQRLLLS